MKLTETLTGPETWCQVDYQKQVDGRTRYCLVGAMLASGSRRARVVLSRYGRMW